MFVSVEKQQQNEKKKVFIVDSFYYFVSIVSRSIVSIQQPVSELFLAYFSNRSQVQNHSYEYNFLSHDANKTYIHMNGVALDLGLKRRLRSTRKWAIGLDLPGAASF